MSNTLEGQVAVVTGSSKGIGAAIARTLARLGASVVANYRSDEAGAQRVVDEIRAQGGDAIAVQADLSTAAGVDRLFDAVSQTYDRLDVLVNNAGVYDFAPIEEVTAGFIDNQVNVNVTGLLLASRRAVQLFGDGGGNIVNISSAISLAPMAQSAVYAGTKGAVDAITRALAAELGPRGIRVNAVSPGPVDTEGAQKLNPAENPAFDLMLQLTPMQRFGTAEEIADVVAYLASSESVMLTGQVLQASGGLAMN